MRKLIKIETNVVYAYSYDSWGVLQVGDVLFKFWNDTDQPAQWRLELCTTYLWLRFCTRSGTVFSV